MNINNIAQSFKKIRIVIAVKKHAIRISRVLRTPIPIARNSIYRHAKRVQIFSNFTAISKRLLHHLHSFSFAVNHVPPPDIFSGLFSLFHRSKHMLSWSIRTKISWRDNRVKIFKMNLRFLAVKIANDKKLHTVTASTPLKKLYINPQTPKNHGVFPRGVLAGHLAVFNNG